ncbi:MAG: tetratricopeptide repeat protein [Draconibacterium sp.]
MKKQKSEREIKNRNIQPQAKKQWLFGSIFLTVVILVLYSQTFSFDFVNWDDDVNIYENENVVDFNIKGIFTEHVIGNYNPLSNLTFAVEYSAFQDDAKWYHINNVILHIICTLLVFLLMKRLGLSFFTSFIIALLFGIHPMRTESVAWVTERKDVLFSLFYLLSILIYVSYIKTRKGILYFLSILIFSLSLLSKIQAVALPFSLLIIDYWLNRKQNVKLYLEKVPFFLLSLATGLIGIYFLRQQGSLDTETTLPFFQRLFIGSYSYIVYLIKSVFPFEMSAIYPFPSKVTLIHYLSIIPAAAIFLLSILAYKTQKSLTFGILFFTLNIVFVLQIVGAGQGFIADRFTYIPYIGLFFIYAIFIEKAITKFQKQKFVIYSALGIYMVILFAMAFNQIKVWKNSETLWTDVIQNEPTTAIAYNNLGHYYRVKGETDKALENYNTTIRLAPQKAQAYDNRGKIYFDRGEYDLALEDYNKSLAIEPEFSEALANRGAVYGKKKQYEKALMDLTRALKINPKNKNALSNRGFVYYNLREFEKSVEDCRQYLELVPNDADIINMVGLCYANMKDYDTALRFYNQSILINPSNAAFYINRSYTFNAKGDKKNALKDALVAKQLGLAVNQAYWDMLNKQ